MRASEDVVTPQSFIHYLRTTMKLRSSQFRLPRRGVLVFGGSDFERVRRAIRGKRFAWSEWEAVGHAGRHRVFVGRSPIGGPGAAIVLEEASVRGVRDWITFGACGSLHADLPIGSVVIPTFAVPDEGTSVHYGAPQRPRPDRTLVAAIQRACERRGLPFRKGGVWTTDAPYRESRAKARALAKQGVLGVEMEAASAYAVARHRGLRAASLFVVSDELGGAGWNPGFRDERFARAKHTAIDALVDAIARPW